MKIFKLLRGEGSPTLFEGHSALALQELLVLQAKGGSAGRAPTAALHPRCWDALWEREAWVPFKQMIFLKHW